jgi:MFS family permease
VGGAFKADELGEFLGVAHGDPAQEGEVVVGGGELGAGITLVSELVGRERRGLATTFVAAVGILGAVAGYFVTQLVSWRGAFTIGR